MTLPPFPKRMAEADRAEFLREWCELAKRWNVTRIGASQLTLHIERDGAADYVIVDGDSFVFADERHAWRAAETSNFLRAEAEAYALEMRKERDEALRELAAIKGSQQGGK